MAVKKNTNEPEVIGAKQKTNAVKDYQHYVYIGPTLPGGKLKCNTVLIGDMQIIKAYYSHVLEEYPQIERLIVPIHRLGEMKEKAQAPGNIINKYYGDVVSSMSTNKEE
ncbi:hypothetical protein EDD70_1073 [Hydrogenoanaerobacterium saccharovorans]|uniref:Uncharacterized protein n=1 Tax=Hydrogenoanaerobacterium saccharovorans TaxID=474960 RepID=A0A1H7ZZL4_9FIRM|nr:hypothetical protein [Hydrogenoanaerobacterium saccharovorans]RPF48258.1 hypothetical protein EDD70_1073 [Hydrogenoanaerobacterium saccharovorans]SEM63900.1 hypothetical protein SAMN05216180_1018 [Hydrogenoanaerobacterium saccharovorans]